MIVTIQTVSQEFTKDGAEYYKVIGVTEKGEQTTKLVFSNLEDKWAMLQENATLEFKLLKKGQFWNVVDILPAPATPPATAPVTPLPQIDEPEVLPETPVSPTGEKPKFQVDGRTHDIHRQVALYCTVSLTCAGLMSLGKLQQNADMLLKYLDGE